MNANEKELNLKRRKEQCFKQANEIHNFQYDYSESEYVNTSTPMQIRCPIHGYFWQKPHSHLNARGCPSCGKSRTKDKRSDTTENYIKVASIVHDNYFKYPNTIYTGSQNKIKIECPIHGEIEVTAINHKRGSGCRKCSDMNNGRNQRKGKDTFVSNAKKVHENSMLNYDKFVYVNNKTKGIITCALHGDFECRPDGHLSRKQGCPQCWEDRRGDSLKQTNEEYLSKLIERRGNEQYTFDKVNYECASCKITVTCQHHGDFDTDPYNFLSGSNCPICANNHTSRPEKELYDFIKNLYPDAQSNVYGMIGRKELDIYIPELNKAIEFNGTYWHYDQSNKNCKPKGYHAMKSNLCKDIGVKLLHVREDLWLNKKEHMKKVIRKFIES